VDYLTTFIALAQVCLNRHKRYTISCCGARSAAQALGDVHSMQSSSDPVASIFRCQILQMVNTFSAQSHFIKAYLVDSSERDCSECPGKFMMGDKTVKVESGSYGRILETIATLIRAGTKTSYSNSTHCTLKCREDVWHQILVATMNTFTMAKRHVSVRRMRTKLKILSLVWEL